MNLIVVYILIAFNTIRLMIDLRQKLRAKSGNPKIYNINDMINPTPYVHFADNWFKPSDLTVRVKIK